VRVPFSYPRSKWIAEKIVTQARDQGLPTVIYRPSIMMGHTETGASHETDYITICLNGFMSIGILPVYDEVLNAIPIDYASKAIVELARRPASMGGTFHLWNTSAVSTNETYPWLQSYGYEFDIVSFDQALDRAMEVDASHPLYPVLPLLHLYASGDASEHMSWTVHQTIDSASECRRTLDALAGSGVECPPLDEDWMHKVLEYLISEGHLFEPGRAPAARPVATV
jgi:thioester reductase-like protein